MEKRKRGGWSGWRLAALGGGAAVVAAAGALLAANLYVQSSGVRERMQSALGTAVGAEVAISRMSYTPWSGVGVRGVTVRGNGDSQKATVPMIRARMDFPALLDRRLVIKQLVIDSPKIEFSQRAREEEPQEKPDTAPDTRTAQPDDARQGMADAADPTAGRPEEPAEAGPAPGKAWQVSLSGLSVEGGTFEITDARGRMIVSCTGIAMTAEPAGDDGTRAGLLTVESVVVRDAVTVKSVRSPFRYDGSSLVMPGITADVEGGVLEGALTLTPNTSPVGYQGKINVRGCNVARLMTSAGLPPDRLSGTLDATASMSGGMGEWTSANGDFRLDLRDGSLSQINLFQTIGQALGIEELVEFQIEEGHATGVVRNGLTTIQPLVLRSPNLRVVADGTIQPDASLALDSKLYIHKKIRKRMPSLAKSNLKKTDDPGLADYQYLEFEIDGTLSQPRSNILERLVGDTLEDKVRGVLKGLFGD